MNISKTSNLDIVSVVKESALAAFVVAALALPLAGFQTVEGSGQLTVALRFSWIVWPTVITFIVRFLILVGGRTVITPMLESSGGSISNLGHWLRRYTVWIGIAFFILALILPFTPLSNRYVLDLGIMLFIYVMLGWGLNIVVGLAGLLDLGYVAFYAVGAYSYALLSTNFGLSFWICLPLAGLFSATFGVLLGFPVLRLRGDYLAIVTLGFGEIIRIVLLNWYTMTNGPDGISGIARPSLFGLMEFTKRPKEGVVAFHQYFDIPYTTEHKFIFFYLLILTLALITNLVALRLRKLPVGRAWEALREDEIACRSLGINPTNTKLTAFAIGAMFAGFAGSFFATRQGFVSPESFTFIESAIILAIVVLGGMGSQIGVVIAAFVLVIGPELIRELQEFRMLVFGGMMVLIMVWRPRGLLSFREPSLRLNDDKGSGGGS